ncbi:MAG: GDSL-type esterase/lipase family protein [Oscillospiraceae bacterium]
MNKKIVRGVRKQTRAPLFIFFALIFIVIALIVTIFAFFVKDDLKKQKETSNVNFNINSSKNDSKPSPSSKPTKPSPSSNPNVSKDKFQTTTILAETKPVEKAYFNDCVFIGDSISLGLGMYNVLPPANVIAAQNVGLNQVAEGKPVYQNKKKTLIQCIDELKTKPKKIYIMLGSNGLPYYDNDTHIKFYNTLVLQLKKKYPEAKIILQSVTPITAKAEVNYKKNGKDFTNKKINDFNEKIKGVAKNNKVYYLDVRASLADEKGFLNAKLISTSPKADGVHFLKVGHEAMYKYYKTHAVDGEVIPVKAK